MVIDSYDREISPLAIFTLASIACFFPTLFDVQACNEIDPNKLKEKHKRNN
jgi:hypothetical protein